MSERVVAIKITSDGKAFVVDQAANAEAVAKVTTQLDALGKKSAEVTRQNAAMTETSKAVAAAHKDSSYAAQVLAERELAAADAADKFMAKLRQQAIEAGKSRTEVLAMAAAQHGVTEGAAPFIAAIDAATKSSHSLSLANAGVTRELLVLGNEAANGNWTRFGSSMNVLGQRSGAAQVAIQALRTPVGMLTAAFVVAAGAVAVLTFEHEKLQRTLNAMEVQLTATGRAGMFTTGELRAMLHELQLMPGVSRDAAVQSIEAFTQTHAIGKALFVDLTHTVADYAVATGQKVPDAAKKLAQAFADPAVGAKTLDKELGLLSATQLAQIETMTRHSDLAGAQRVLFDALQSSVRDLATKGLTPLQTATHELGLAWERMTHSMGESTALRGVELTLVGIANAASWLMDHSSQIGAALKFTPVGGLISGAEEVQNLFGGSGAGKREASGKVGQSDDYKAVQDQIKRVTELNSSYIGAAAAAEQMRQREAELKNTIALATQELGAQDPAVLKLKNELTGLQEALAKKPANTDAINASVEALRGQAKLQEQVVKQNVANIESLAKQGVISQVDAIRQETAARLAGVNVEEALAKRELAALKGKQNSLTERARIENQLMELAQKRAGIVSEGANKEAEEIRKKSLADDAASDKFVKASEAEIVKINEEAAALEYAVAMHGKTAQAIREVEIARLEEQKTIVAGFDASDQEVDRINRKIAALQRLVSATGAKDAQSAVDAAAKHAEQSWQRTYNSIERGLEDALADGGNSGLKKLEKDFKQWAAHLVISPILQPISAFGASVVNGSAGGAGNSAMNGVNTASGLYNLGSAGSSLYTVGSQYVGGTMSGANAVGTIYGNATGSGIDGLLAVNGGYASSAAGTATTFGVVDSTVGTSAAVAGGTEAGTGALAAAGPYGWIALAAIAAIAYFSSQGGGPKRGGQASPYTVPGFDVGAQDNAGANVNLKLAQSGIQAQYDAIAKSFGGQAGAMRFGLGVSTDPEGTAQSMVQVGAFKDGQLAVNNTNINVGRTDQELQAAIADQTADVVFKALKASALDKAFTDFFATVADDASTAQENAAVKVAQDVLAYTAPLKDLGGVFSQLADLSVLARDGMIQAAGGLQALQQATASYYDNFYSDVEKRQITAQQISRTLSSAGLGTSTEQVLGASREQFRALVDSLSDLSNPLNITTDAGQKAFTALMNVSSAFAGIVPAANAAASATTDLQSAATDLESVASGLQSATESVQSALRSVSDEVQRFAVEAARSTAAVGETRHNISGAYFAALDAQAQAQQRVNDLIRGSIKTIDDVLASSGAAGGGASLATLKARFSATSVLAAGGDGASLDKLVGQAQAVLQAAEASSSTRVDYARQQAFVRQQLEMVRKAGADYLAGKGEDIARSPINEALADLATASKRTADLLALAGEAGASIDPALRDASFSIAGLSAAYYQALSGSITAQSNYDAALAATAGLQLTTAGTFDTLNVSLHDLDAASAAATTTLAQSAGALGGQFDALRASLAALLGTLGAHGPATSTATGVSAAQISDFIAYASPNGGTADEIRNIYDEAMKYHVSSSQVDEAMHYAPGTALRIALENGLPAFETGTNIVPRTGPALVHQNEMIVPAKFNPALLSRGADSGEVVAELRAQGERQAAENAALRQIVERQGDQLAKLHQVSQDTAKTLDTVTRGGRAMQTEVFA